MKSAVVSHPCWAGSCSRSSRIGVHALLQAGTAPAGSRRGAVAMLRASERSLVGSSGPQGAARAAGGGHHHHHHLGAGAAEPGASATAQRAGSSASAAAGGVGGGRRSHPAGGVSAAAAPTQAPRRAVQQRNIVMCCSSVRSGAVDLTASTTLDAPVEEALGAEKQAWSEAAAAGGAGAAAGAQAPLLLAPTRGTPQPLGASLAPSGKGVNFALFSHNATAVTLCLYLDGNWDGEPSREMKLEPAANKTGDVWHICVEGLPLSGVSYGYRLDGPRGREQGHRFDPSIVVLDPYAKLVEGRRVFGDRSKRGAPFRGTYDFESFDWGPDYRAPGIPENELIIYEMTLRAFTADESSQVEPGLRGSYKGVIEKVSHLRELGVNAVELLPCMEYDELEFQRYKNDRDHMVNVWGYSTVNFFSPMSRYASNGGGPVAASREFKEMVKAMHAAGIEVIMDVVYNHTNEVDDVAPWTTSFRGVDNTVYYMVDTSKPYQMMNFSGCGNTLNCNQPTVMEMVLDSLRHWVTEYHVDGFRFDLASALCRGTKGEVLPAPPLIRAISKDPVLSKAKLIAEPWDCGGLYQVGSFPNWDRWAEWNGKYRDTVRSFIKGDMGVKKEFATRISGSADMYNTNKRKPYHSINFIVAHDGFTLADLVSYNQKHNEANGEQGRDGCNDNFSWNCGEEGATDRADIRALRYRQIKNFHVCLMISQGTPMMLMGDEYGHTRGGNNNSYGHDSAMNNFQWKKLAAEQGLFRFFSKVNQLRRQHPSLGRESFLTPKDVTWHEDNWDNPDSRFLAFMLHEGPRGGGALYCAFNAHVYFVQASLPPAPGGQQWLRLVDTNLPSPEDFVSEGPTVGPVYSIAPFSTIVLRAANKA